MAAFGRRGDPRFGEPRRRRLQSRGGQPRAPARGALYLDRGVDLAREHGLDGIVALAYVNIGSSYGEQYRFADDDCLDEGVAYRRGERGLDHSLVLSWLALTQFYQRAAGRTPLTRPSRCCARPIWRW